MEFAIIAPVLFVLLFGVIEFGFAFVQYLDVKHGAREGARLVAVNYRPDSLSTPAQQADDVIEEICDRMDSGAGTTVTITLPSQPGSPGRVGQEADVAISHPVRTITGFFDQFLTRPLTSDVAIRLEVDSTFLISSGASYTGTCT